MIRHPVRADLLPYGARLFDAWKLYGETVSPLNMAASLWTASLMWWLCDAIRADRACDLGSGFSSYVLRRYAQGKDVEVVSVDDDPGWLAKTAGFLDSQGVDAGQLVTYDEWQQSRGEFDVILHDINGGAVREQTMRPAVDRLSARGAIIFDDAQKPTHRRHMAQVAHSTGLLLLDVWAATVDEINRYSLLGVRP